MNCTAWKRLGKPKPSVSRVSEKTDDRSHKLESPKEGSTPRDQRDSVRRKEKDPVEEIHPAESTLDASFPRKNRTKYQEHQEGGKG